MTKFAWILLLVLVTGSVCRAAETDADWYVSTNGSDSWSGTLAEPNPQGNDGPFATLQRARDAIRELGGRPSNDVVVLVREGTYRLDETVVFGLQDSPQGDATVTYAAYPGETPVFSSGKTIDGWKKVTETLPGLPDAAVGHVWAADVSDRFFTLYDDEGMLPRARSAGFIPLSGGSRNRLHFPKGRLKNWPNVKDVEIIVRPHHAWISNVLPLASVDEQTQLASTSIDATYAMNKLHFLPTVESCWVENVLEELDEPGEWVLNTKQGKVYLWPRNQTPVVAPQLTELIRIEGDVDKQGPKDIPARNLCFRGLTFLHGERYLLTADDAGLQHDWDMHDKANALVRLRGTENCAIEQCRFAHSGSGAIRVDLHGRQNKISGNHIEQMGGAGILLCGYGPGTKDVNRNNLVLNNHIHHLGRIYLHSPAILVWQSGNNRVANNLIHHMPYCGIIVSGFMTHFFDRNGRELCRTIRKHEVGDVPRNPTLEEVRTYLHSRDNTIESNEIHHVMETMGDGNGIYIRGAGAGNVIRRNYIHHLVTPMLMQAAIRTDGGQRDTLIAENLIYKCMAQGIILKLNNRAENNIVADVLAPPRGYYLSLREGPMEGAVIKRNIFYSMGNDTVFIDELAPGKGRKTEDSRGRELARSKDADTDFNIYYSSTDPELAKQTLEKQQGDGVDANSRATDPMFVDPENGDFRFKPGSPALEMGIIPIDLSQIGLRNTQHKGE
ncbi:right-handed parallel beta-helix repeat-containing protein [Stieleria sp. ICT_E10.1]|uniref:right-handed parallel beta-helix repeat-containing protein n=1 Tax=Stieleria sedimenti TaxID=2976331 RepID=UPI0021803C24|nr:right-handed parallel beta-helix repeat-containing protein [Stieleria sedimenti]MCS7469945.1 right-handed parallel beta-helix repeat-containing protein [Stieleria sedimenti]